ncbi:ATP-dependent DNA ligase [Candidatus Scalindua japonica]|uniref:ATP-dependent DNA ligase n=1 Tax=Candidatus Scalindua japonica TaxID=1284222 RepID=A0A286TTA2_9BACT|nr:hypothetical protein [Candidatus Scalindua japonica]GAX59085.1 ATP-dependent DNA ligase [Candidatus Scalindua japonica]
MKKILVNIIFVFAVATIVGCVYAPPMKVTVSDLVDMPSLYRNKKVEISGYVVRNEYSGDRFVNWQLIIEENGKRIYCYENGYNTTVIAKCVHLAEEAKVNNEKIIVTGQLREGGYRDVTSDDTILELKTFEYNDHKIDTDYERDKWLHPAHDTYDLHSYGH